MHSQQMPSITPIVIGCNDYLAYGTIFTRAMFCPKIKLDVFFPPEKPLMSAGGWWLRGLWIKRERELFNPPQASFSMCT
jgi:hypothetical protein